MNFCATKFISLVAFEQLNTPTPQPGFRSIAACIPDAALSRASSHVAVRRPPFERTIGSVSRTSPFLIEASSFPPAPGASTILCGRSTHRSGAPTAHCEPAPGAIRASGEEVIRMKLAEALAERADAQRRLAQLKQRVILSARVQEGERAAGGSSRTSVRCRPHRRAARGSHQADQPNEREL